MNLREYLSISPEVMAALQANKPVVALPSVLFFHDVSQPDIVVQTLEQSVRSANAVPAAIAIINGVLKVGLCAAEHRQLRQSANLMRASRQDIPVLVATGGTGITTVAASMIIASLARIHVLATDGIGGAGQNAQQTLDISADLQELRKSSVLVVCSGVNLCADVGATLEYLETMGVPVLGVRTADFPVLYCRKSNRQVDRAAKDEAETARIAKIKWDLGLTGGLLAVNPVPSQYALDVTLIDTAARDALAKALLENVHGPALTPYLTACIVQATGGAARETHLKLMYDNARTAGQIAAAYARL